MTPSTTTQKTHVVWQFFRSVKLTIVLLILLAAASIIGTIIPQMPQRESIEFARRLSPGVFRFFNALDLFDMYRSLWFRSLLGCLAVNLIVCSVDRFPGTWKLFRARPKPDRNKPFEGLPEHHTFTTEENIQSAFDKISRYLKHRYGKPAVKERSGTYFFYAEKGGYSRFGFYLVHFSVLLILTGAMVGSFSGFEAFVNILEGETVDIHSVHLRRGNLPKGLNFEIRCDDFNVDFHENGTPREFRSDLTFLSNEREIEKKKLRVNHPVQFRGITFYQSTYGSIPGKTVRLKLSKHEDGAHAETLVVEAGKPVPLPVAEGRLAVVDVKGDFMNTGAAVLLEIIPEYGEKQHMWLFHDYDRVKTILPGPMLLSPKFDPSAYKPYTFFLESIETRFYTGLQVNKDPGVSIVWAGFFLIIAGFMVTFFTFHKRIWVRLSPEGGKNRVHVAGSSNRNPVGLDRELMHVINGLADRLGKKG